MKIIFENCKDNRIRKDKGTMYLVDKVMVSDPCYGLGTWGQGVLEDVLSGQYKCIIEYSDEGVLGQRVSRIFAVHVDYVKANAVYNFERTEIDVGVDSGMAGIFDYDYYEFHHSDYIEKEHVDNEWYDRAFDATIRYEKNPYYDPIYVKALDKMNDDEFLAYLKDYGDHPEKEVEHFEFQDGNVIDHRGFVSGSGYGDGGYDCYITKNSDGKIVGICVEYIGEEEEEE